MLGPVDYAMAVAVLVTDFFCVASILKRRAFSRYFGIVLFLLVSMAVGVGRCFLILTVGYASDPYYYFYYYSNVLLTLSLFVVLMSFYSQVFMDMGVGKLLRGGAMLLLGGTILISYYMVSVGKDQLVRARFAIELSQNLFFVGLVLTYLLWGAMIKMRENRTRLVQLVLALGIFLSAFAASFALFNMYPDLAVWRYFLHFISLWLPCSYTYTFLKVPEDARMATARVVAPSR